MGVGNCVDSCVYCTEIGIIAAAIIVNSYCWCVGNYCNCLRVFVVISRILWFKWVNYSIQDFIMGVGMQINKELSVNTYKCENLVKRSIDSARAWWPVSFFTLLLKYVIIHRIRPFISILWHSMTNYRLFCNEITVIFISVARWLSKIKVKLAREWNFVKTNHIQELLQIVSPWSC